MPIGKTQMKGIRCQSCRRLMIPPVYNCLSCGGDKFSEEELSGKGKIYSVVTADLPGIGFENVAPYFLAAVELEDKLMFVARIITLSGSPKIGDSVQFVSAEQGKYVFSLVD